MTSNHDYNTPSKGSTDWHVPLNENFEAIDTDIEIRDADANRDQYEPKQGSKFFATDTEDVYLGDGSSWRRVDTSGRNPTYDSIKTESLNGTIVVHERDGEDIADAFNRCKETHGLENQRYLLPPGDYGTVTTPFDLTGKTGGGNAHIDLSGVNLHYANEGEPLFDLTASHNKLSLDLRGSTFLGSSERVPSVGLLFARDSSRGSAGNHEVYGGTFDGNWSAAPFYNMGAELLTVYGTELYNYESGARSAFYQGIRNPDGVTSPFRGELTGVSASTNRYYGINATGRNCKYGVYLTDHIFHSRWYSPIINPGTSGFIHFDASHSSINDVKFDNPFGEKAGNSPRTVISATASSSEDHFIQNLVIDSGNLKPTEWFAELPPGVIPDRWSLGWDPQNALNTQQKGIKIEHSASRVLKDSKINLKTIGDLHFPNDSEIYRARFRGSSDRITGSPTINKVIFDDRSGATMEYWEGGVPRMELRYGEGCWRWRPTDLSASSAPAPSVGGTLHYHSGSSGFPEGFYRSDPSNGQFVKVGDNGTTIPYQ